ncbi:hypothetical protein SRRS_46450 [Sporomusa rhizae]|uniref:hypothetical protein n=1 Tax=Sporomusa rhizae TaxID=357999 RepID=UPI00352BAB0D
MNEIDKYTAMSLEQLEVVLSEEKDLLEDVEQERKFWLINTTVHIPGHKARHYETEINTITNNIAMIEQVIKQKRAK